MSSEFHDHFQVDLIDMRTMRKMDVYGVMQRWIMTIKDHQLVLCILPRSQGKLPSLLRMSWRNTLALWGILTFSIQVCDDLTITLT